jgi:PAS domain S-box-containing protein
MALPFWKFPLGTSVAPLTPTQPKLDPPRRWLAAALGLVLFHLCFWLAGRQDGLWLPGLGLGIVLVAWFGYWVTPFLALDLLLVWALTAPERGLVNNALDALLLAAQIALSWWCYADLARGSRGLEDPRSATSFLIIVPGALSAAFALAQAVLWVAQDLMLVPGALSAALAQAVFWVAQDAPPNRGFWELASTLGLSRTLGILTVAPLLLVQATPWLQRWSVIAPPRSSQRPVLPVEPAEDWGESIELLGLGVGNVILTLALVTMQVQHGYPGWGLWGVSLLLVVWTSLRQGLRGGLLVASVGSILGLCIATILGAGATDLTPLQGNLLAQCSTALLVGASSSWIQAGEARYRRVVGHIPVILYSVRLPRAVLARLPGNSQPDIKLDSATGPSIVEEAEVTLVSRASKQIFGVEAASLEGPFKRWLEMVHPADREVMLAALTQLCLQKQPVTCEYRVAPPGDVDHHPEGAKPREPEGRPTLQTTWVRDTLAPHHTSEGRLDGWDGVIEDITEARALSHNLGRTTAMLQALVANLPMGVFFVQGPHGTPILVNARARQLLGQREDMAAGVTHMTQVYRLHRPDGSVYPIEELPVTKALREGLTCMANDIVVYRPDGRRMPLMTWAAPIDLGGAGQPEAAVWVLEDLNDITLHRTAQETLHQAKARYQHLVESLPIIVLQLDAEHRVVYCNPHTQAVTGYTFAEFREPGLFETMVAPEDRPRCQDALQKALAGQPSRLEFRFIAKGGEHKVGYVLVQPHLQQGQVKGTMCLMVDMTVQRRLEEELQKSQRLELMGRLASGTVHDFNNMLTALMGMAAIARGGLPAEHPVYDDITRIIDIGVQASDLAGQLLAFSKQRRTLRRPVDLNTIVVHSLKILKGVIPPSIEIESQLTDGDLWVNADDTQLKQVVMNLCINARDAMPQGGSLRVRTRSYGDNGKCWSGFVVQDTGCGMDEATVARIFDPFFSTKERGSGLGLAVVQQILERFGGRIDVHSRPGEGTTMEVWLESCPPPTDGAEG